MKLIAFTGSMGAGKSTAIEQLKTLFDGPVTNVKFAQPLYDMQEAVYERVKPTYVRPLSFIKDRRLLQLLGVEWGRTVLGSNIWVDLWKQDVSNLTFGDPTDRIITCDDCRFDNEAEAIRALGGFVVQVTSDKTLIDKTTGVKSHASEQGVDPRYIDAIIENNGSVEDLRESLMELNNTFGIW